MAFGKLKEMVKEKMEGDIANKLLVKIDELILEQKKVNEKLERIIALLEKGR